MTTEDACVLSLDVGERRIGVAQASLATGFAHPLMTLESSGSSFDDISRLVNENKARVVVIGLPRGLAGQDTRQTEYVRQFAQRLSNHIAIPIAWQDEALTSKQAEAELEARGKKYEKADVDALAATYILEDYLASERQKESHAV